MPAIRPLGKQIFLRDKNLDTTLNVLTDGTTPPVKAKSATVQFYNLDGTLTDKYDDSKTRVTESPQANVFRVTSRHKEKATGFTGGPTSGYFVVTIDFQDTSSPPKSIKETCLIPAELYDYD